MSNNKVSVGVGIIILNDKNQILIGKRIGSHAQKYSILGGGVDLGESFEAAAIREAKEELGIHVSNINVIGLTNNLETYEEEHVHSVSVILLANAYQGIPIIQEPKKCAELVWCDPHDLPEPHYDASKQGIELYLKNAFYLTSQ